MQIHRFHSAGSAAAPRVNVRGSEGSPAGTGANSITAGNDLGGAVGGGELERLISHLGEFSDVRADVVAEAKVRVQRGDYLTRAVAEKTANALLNTDV